MKRWIPVVGAVIGLVGSGGGAVVVHAQSLSATTAVGAGTVQVTHPAGSTKTVVSYPSGIEAVAWFGAPSSSYAQSIANAEAAGMTGASTAPSASPQEVEPESTTLRFGEVYVCVESACALQEEGIEGDYYYNGSTAWSDWQEKIMSCDGVADQCSLVTPVYVSDNHTAQMIWRATYYVSTECGVPVYGCVVHANMYWVVGLLGSGGYNYSWSWAGFSGSG